MPERVRRHDAVDLLSRSIQQQGAVAVANSPAGLQAGCRQVECAINGLGERAGDASLQEMVMMLHTRAPYLGLATGIDTTEIARTSRLVSRLTGYPVQPNKAIVGRNAFAHESGIRQDGVLMERTTYEIMEATMVGLLGATSARDGRRAHTRRRGDVGSFTGDGPIDAIFHAINAATGVDARLREFRIGAVTGGQDALGETRSCSRLAESSDRARESRPTSLTPPGARTSARCQTRYGDSGFRPRQKRRPSRRPSRQPPTPVVAERRQSTTGSPNSQRGASRVLARLRTRLETFIRTAAQLPGGSSRDAFRADIARPVAQRSGYFMTRIVSRSGSAGSGSTIPASNPLRR
jgi:hypothetical protein